MSGGRNHGRRPTRAGDGGVRGRSGEMADGAGMTGGRGTAIRQPARWHERSARAAAAVVVSIAALWSVGSLVLRGFWRFAGEEAFGAVNLPVGANLFSVALLFLLAGTLHRRLRFGLWMLVLFQALALLDAAAQVGLGLASAGPFLAHFGPTERAELLVSAAAAAVLIPVLVAVRDALPARLYPASRRAAVLVLSIGLALSAALSLLLVELFPAHAEPPG